VLFWVTLFIVVGALVGNYLGIMGYIGEGWISAYLLMAVGLVSRRLAERSVYFELILIFLGGVLGTGHHLYWAGEPGLWVPMGSMFSFIEVLPLVLVVIEAIQHHRLIKADPQFKYGLAYTYIVGAAFWNFVGAGVLGLGTLMLLLPVTANQLG
jgi:nitric oxide reductase subunit B